MKRDETVKHPVKTIGRWYVEQHIIIASSKTLWDMVQYQYWTWWHIVICDSMVFGMLWTSTQSKRWRNTANHAPRRNCIFISEVFHDKKALADPYWNHQNLSIHRSKRRGQNPGQEPCLCFPDPWGQLHFWVNWTRGSEVWNCCPLVRCHWWENSPH